MNKAQALRAAIGGALLSAGVVAHAALPAAVTTAVETAETDLVSLYGTLTAAGVVIWVARVIYGRFRVR